MKKLIILSLSLFSMISLQAQQKDYTQLVNPFIGTGGHGHVFPGASAPFGMVQLSPDTRDQGWDACGGYYYADSTIYGFSHTHLSGTGIQDYADILLMPSTGEFQWKKEDFKSSFSHDREEASPGYYKVHLNKHNIDVQLTATERAGMQEYTFPASAEKGNVLVDLNYGDGDHVLHSWMRVINDSTVIGLRESQGWAHDQILYFALKFSQPIQDYQFAKNDSAVNTKDSLSGDNVKAYFTFNINGKPILAKVGLSAVSTDGAMQNLNTEMPGFDFNNLKQKAHDQWAKELGKIEVQGGTKDQQTMFYTALYHSYLSPNIYQDVDGKFRGTDLKVHQADNFTNYTVFSLWDTYRAFNPLMTILEPKRTNDWINTFLAQYKYGGMTPIWELSGNETYVMIGHHSVPVIVDAYQKGIRDYDTNEALKAMEDYAESNRFGLKAFREKGYIGQDDERESVSRTLENSYDDWCIATMARLMGKDNDYKKYIQWAQYYKNLYDPSTGFFRGKDGDMWFTPFHATDVNGFYTEANAWQYNFASQQDVSGMVNLHGGKKPFTDQLNEFFTTSSELTGNAPPDISGMIGQYAHGDEPSHHIAYLFDYVGMPWRTQELVHKISTTLYHNDPNGESGNDDCGQMSAWLVMSAMGFYQVCPGSPEYAFGTPMFDEVKIHLPNGKTFTIQTNNHSADNYYIQSAKLNGQAYQKSYITHSDILNGATLTFDMGPQAAKDFATNDEDCPTSAINNDQITPVPFVKPADKRFHESATVTLGDADPQAVIYYTTDGSTPNSSSKKYSQPIMINKTAKLKMMATSAGKTDSKVATEDFYKMPHNWDIKVDSKVNDRFTKADPDLLIDGRNGTVDNRKAEGWQSYGDHFEAVIDLKKSMTIHKLGLSLLQYKNALTWFPSAIDFYLSTDGQHFTKAATINPSKADGDQKTKVFEKAVNVKGQYVKVTAASYGNIPQGARGAGRTANLAIDEIIIQ